MEKPLSSFSSSSGDPRMDRRYAWAEAAFAEGDRGSAIDILHQTLAEAPGFAAAWHLYGRALATPERFTEAADAWRHYLTLDPQDHLGATLDLARIGALPAEQTSPEIFSRGLFDAYAERFDSHLVENLHYDAPARLRHALARILDNAGRPFRFATVHDLGCGTGLMGEAIRAEAGVLAGCDISPRMIARARAKTRAGGLPLYDELAVAGLTDYLRCKPGHSSDLILAADVFVYLGDLAPVFAESARVLEPGGLFAFTVQSHEGEGVIVGEDRRFAHAEVWLRDRLAQAGLTPLSLEAASTRQDRGAPVPGLVVVAQRG